MIVNIFSLLSLVCLVCGQGSPCCTQSSKWEMIEGFNIGAAYHGQGYFTEVNGYNIS